MGKSAEAAAIGACPSAAPTIVASEQGNAAAHNSAHPSKKR
jgi:hypothetical protein